MVNASYNNIPLAERLRPKNFADFAGQEHLVGENGIVVRLIKAARSGAVFPSLILWGPPGSGKTTMARIIARELNAPFFEFSAVNASIKEIQQVTRDAEVGKRPIVFIDEIHRFNKAQQDRLLPHVERGEMVVIGATTENPSFEIIGPLLSRTRVLVLKQLSTEWLGRILAKALGIVGKKLGDEGKEFLLEAANGDARILLNVVEIAASITGEKEISVVDLEEALQRRQLSFDLKGEEFYNTISALHKSIRGSDPDAALYYLARMLEAGQDPLYIARRLVRAASEDIGMADFRALLIAQAAFDACNELGMPECNMALAQVVVYLATAKKSNALYMAYGEAAHDVHQYGNLPVPMHIRNAVTKLMKEVGYGKNYNYYHSPIGEKLSGVDYLPDKLRDRKYWSKRVK